jgi:hypothetical protein
MPSPIATSEIVKRNIAPPNAGFPKTAPSISAVSWSWDGVGGAIRGLCTFNATTEVFDVGADNANLADGIQIAALPAGVYLPIMSRVKGNLSSSLAAGENANGEIGLGTVVASGAVAVLGGTATFENWMDGQAIAAITAGNAVAQNHAAVADLGLNESFGSTVPLFLNIAAAFSNEAEAHRIRVDAGFQVEILFHYLPVEVTSNQV